tara:strand:+ start:61 stop:327 length:267 start_codon:yes stop_codon:yes gene_type:complete
MITNNKITKENFTFQTVSEYFQKVREFNEFDFNCVRIRTTYKDGQTIVSTHKTFEDYNNFIEQLDMSPNVESYEVTPKETFFEREFYL